MIMLEIKNTLENGTVTAIISGRIDSTNAGEFDKGIELIDTAEKLILDVENLEYISSAGLRVILALQKTMSKKEGMKVCNVNSDIMEVFEITGFSDMLTIE